MDYNVCIKFVKKIIMSAYTTQTITRKEAERKFTEIITKELLKLSTLSNTELEEFLNEFAYNGKHEDVLGVLYNFRIKYNETI